MVGKSSLRFNSLTMRNNQFAASGTRNLNWFKHAKVIVLDAHKHFRGGANTPEACFHETSSRNITGTPAVCCLLTWRCFYQYRNELCYEAMTEGHIWFKTNVIKLKLQQVAGEMKKDTFLCFRSVTDQLSPSHHDDTKPLLPKSIRQLSEHAQCDWGLSSFLPEDPPVFRIKA